MSPMHGFMSPRISSPMHPSGGTRGRGGGGIGRGGASNIRRDRDLIGTTIKITGGPYKGLFILFHLFLMVIMIT